MKRRRQISLLYAILRFRVTFPLRGEPRNIARSQFEAYRKSHSSKPIKRFRLHIVVEQTDMGTLYPRRILSLPASET